MRIHKKLTFPAEYLKNYLKTVDNFSKLEHEILAALTFQKAYEKIFEESTMIGFPHKPGAETNLNKMGIIPAKNVGKFISQYGDESSPMDAIIVNPINNKPRNNAIYRPLQIKYLGKGDFKNVTEEKFIKFLKKYSDYQSNKYSLIIVLDGKIKKLELRVVVDWLNENKFPFGEVVLIHAPSNLGDIEYFQLKPTKETFSSIKMTREELLS